MRAVLCMFLLLWPIGSWAAAQVQGQTLHGSTPATGDANTTTGSSAQNRQPSASSNPGAPIDCYNKGKMETTLNTNQVIQLCRCARGVGPIECFLKGRQTTTLDENQLLDLCASQSLLYGLECVGPR